MSVGRKPSWNGGEANGIRKCWKPQGFSLFRLTPETLIAPVGLHPALYGIESEADFMPQIFAATAIASRWSWLSVLTASLARHRSALSMVIAALASAWVAR